MYDRETRLATIVYCGWDMTAAAKELRLDRGSLVHWLRRIGVKRPDDVPVKRGGRPRNVK
jgi:transposase